MWEYTVKPETIYDFDYTLHRLSFDPLIRLNKAERWIDVPVVIREKKHVVRVKARGDSFHPEFIISGEDKAFERQLIRYIQHLFEWDKDLNNVHEHFMGTNLERLFRDNPGTPIVKDFDVFFCLMKTIIHQQLNMKFAYVLSTRFVELLGEKRDGVWFYPTPEKVAATDYAKLQKLQFSRRKAEYVIDTAKMIAGGELDLLQLVQQGDDEILNQLKKVRGLGPWTIENWLMFGLGRENLFPAADIGLQNALKLYFNRNKKPSLEEMAAMSADWAPYKSYASLTLWRSIE